MRVLTWNLKGAGQHSPAWDKLKELKPDIALLQEIGNVPSWVTGQGFDIINKPAVTKKGGLQKFGTAVLVKGKIVEEVPLLSKHTWAIPIFEFFKGNFVSCIVRLESIVDPIYVVSVYSPAWSIEESPMRNQLNGVDLSPIKLKGNPELWPTEILWLALKEIDYNNNIWIVGGDYNSSPRFDERKPNGSLFSVRMRGTKEVLDRMKNLGFTECLYTYHKKSIPTYKNARSQRIEDQLDHLFVTSRLLAGLEDCNVGGREIFEKNISDHLPIIADFNL